MDLKKQEPKRDDRTRPTHTDATDTGADQSTSDDPTARSGSEPSNDKSERSGWQGIIQHYLPELIYGANDGIVTTLAVISGVVGAQFSNQVVLILGFASLFADAFSMGASNYLSNRSQSKASDRMGRKEAFQNGLATFVGFIVAGVIPLAAYLLPWFDGQPFWFAIGLALIALFAIGASRAFFTDRGWLRAGMEMLVVGALASAVAYGVGILGSSLTGGQGA